MWDQTTTFSEQILTVVGPSQHLDIAFFKHFKPSRSYKGGEEVYGDFFSERIFTFLRGSNAEDSEGVSTFL